MTIGYKTGGRGLGTPNKRTAEVKERLEALGCDPIEGMARIAMDETVSAEIRGRMYSELAGYLYPKRKAIDHSLTEHVEPEQELSKLEVARRIAFLLHRAKIEGNDADKLGRINIVNMEPSL